MDYTPYKESECALQENDRLKFVYDFSVYNYIKNWKSIFCSNEMCINHISQQNKSCNSSELVFKAQMYVTR